MIPDRDLVPWTTPTCVLVRVPRGQQFGLRSRASGRLHGTPCLSRISETPKDFDHTIVSTFGRTAAPPVRPPFLLQQPGLPLSLLLPQTRLCVILFWNPQCLVHCTPACPLHRPATVIQVTFEEHQVYLVDEIPLRLTRNIRLTHSSLGHTITAHTHSHTHRAEPFSFSTRSGTREILRHLAFLQDRVVVLTCRNTKRT